MSIYKYDKVNIKKINYNKPEKNGSYYYSSINYDNKPLHIKSPKMKCNCTSEEIIAKGNLECETLNEGFDLYDFFLNIEDKNIKETFKKNKEWFGKEIPLDMIDDMYKRTIKAVKKDHKPQFSFKVPISKGKLQCQIYDNTNICLDINKITPDSEIVFILHIRGLKFLKQHYYCDVYVSQIKVFLEGDTKYNILESYSFNDKEEEEAELNELEQDLMLDEDFLKSIQNKDEEKQDLKLKLVLAKELLIKQENNIKDLENRLDEF